MRRKLVDKSTNFRVTAAIAGAGRRCHLRRRWTPAFEQGDGRDVAGARQNCSIGGSGSLAFSV
jgi:hypothetical protein